MENVHISVWKNQIKINTEDSTEEEPQGHISFVCLRYLDAYCRIYAKINGGHGKKYYILKFEYWETLSHIHINENNGF